MELSWAIIEHIILLLILPWAIWVTKSVYDMSKEQAIIKVQYKDLKEDLKEGIKEIKSMIHDLQYGGRRLSPYGRGHKSPSTSEKDIDIDE